MGGNALKIPALMITMGLGFSLGLFSQTVPSIPFSIPVNHPVLINPAFSGSKDFTNITLTSRVLKFSSQALTLHKRLKARNGSYSRNGLGAFAFNEHFSTSWNTGFGLNGTYHLPLDQEHLHNISGGVSLKGIISGPKKSEMEAYDSAQIAFTPDLDLGIYYYGPHAYAGISVTSLFESSDQMDSLTRTYATIRRSYHLCAGYKFILYRDLGIVLEPSLLVSLNDETLKEPHRHITPYLKVYLQNFYLGTYFEVEDFDSISLFFQYQFPRWFTGLFIEFPRKGYLNDDNIVFELSVGVNLGRNDTKFLQHRHW